MVQSRISRCSDNDTLGRVSVAGRDFPLQGNDEYGDEDDPISQALRGFPMACGNALKHLKNAQKLLKKLICHGIRRRDLLELVTGERSGSEEQEQDCTSHRRALVEP